MLAIYWIYYYSAPPICSITQGHNKYIKQQSIQISKLSHSHNQNKPAQKQIEQANRIQCQFSLPFGHQLPHKCNRCQKLPQKVHKVAHIKLRATRINLMGDGINLPISIVTKETTLSGNRQQPNMQALWKNDISEPRKLAFRYTTSDPTHITKNIEVIIVDASFSVRNVRVIDSIKVSKNGPHRSPTQIVIKCTVHELTATCLSQGWYHGIPELHNYHIKISFLSCNDAWVPGQQRLANQASSTFHVVGPGDAVARHRILYRNHRGSIRTAISSFKSTLDCVLCLTQSNIYNYSIKQYHMINTQYIVLLLFVVACVSGLRQSDIGNNDWAIDNLGKIDEIAFMPFNAKVQDHKNRQARSLFYLSELGIFGHLARKDGVIQSREFVKEGQKILQSDDKQLIILTKDQQIVRYNKLTMHRLVDNRLTTKALKNLHSYVKANGKIYAADDNVIIEYEGSPKKIEELSTVAAPGGSVLLKVFATTDKQVSTLHALTYYSQREQVCINQAKQKDLIQKNCMKAKLSSSTPYVKSYPSTGNIYFGDSTDHYYINFLNFDSQKFNSKPTTFAHFGVKFENGLTFTTKGMADGNVIMVESNRDDKTVYGELTDGHLYVHLGTETAIGDKIATICLEGREFGVSRVWANFLSHTDVEVVVEFQDLQLVLFTHEGKEFKQAWSREQSLAYVHKVLFMKYEGFQDHLNNPYHMKMDDPHYTQLSLFDKLKQVPTNLISRIKTQFEDVFNFVIEKVEGLKKTFTNPKAFQELLDIKGYLKSNMNQESEKKYGLQKYIIVITKYNTIFSLDSKTCSLIWKKKYDSDLSLVTLIKLKQQYQKQISIFITYKYHITYITQIHEDGSLTPLQQFQTFDKPTVHKISAHSILITADDKVHRYDVNRELLGAEMEKEYSFYSVQEGEGRRVVGWKVVNEEIIKTWTLELPDSEKIVKTKSAYRGQPEANLPLVNDKKVLFKNVDFSNIAVLTLQQYSQQAAEGAKTSHRLHLYLINGLTGTILFSEYQIGISPLLPMNLVYDQHNAIVSYYNTRNRVYEIWSVEAFQVPNQSQLISKKYEPLFQKEDILFRSKVYGTVLPIKHLVISQSKQALLRRNVLIVTRQNKINSLPRQLISTRRPKTNQPETNAASPDAEYISSKYPPEQYIIPLNTLGYLNYNKQLADIEEVRFSSSDLESTIFVMGYGVDIFLTRIAPDKAFDMLADGFNYVQLVAIMVAVTVAALFFKNKAKEARLRKPHLD